MGRNIDLDWIANCADVFAHSNGHMLCAGTFEIDGDAEQSKPWHYINLPISDDPDASTWTNYCANGDCVAAQIRQDMATLQDPHAPRHAKQIALMYLIHFVGDAHQPLHCADDHDGGGNFKPVNVQAKGEAKFLNLHQVWDHIISNPDPAAGLQAPEDFNAEADNLAAGLEKDLADPQSHPPGEIASWTQGDLPSQMILESFQIAKTVIYPEYAQDHGHIADSGDPHDIGKDYQDRMQPIAYRRIEMAGVRLALLLEQALGQPQPTGASGPHDFQPFMRRINDMGRRLHDRPIPF